MKKFFALLCSVFVAFSAFAADNAIAVPAPKTVNIADGNEWIPLFIQGVITSNLQQYSGLTVIDRQNVDMVRAEQKLGESAIFSDADALELGNLTHARLIVTGSIMQKGASYALNFSITDAETGETKASASVPNCLQSALENGEAANQISYDLMKSFGVKLSSEAVSALTKSASVMTATVSAQANVAKGIVAEKNGANIEALTYYVQAKKNDRNLSEVSSRMQNMTSIVASGNFGANAKNMMKLRSDWDKLLRQAAELIASNPPTFELRYFSDIQAEEMTAKDYERGTMSFTVSSPYLWQSDDGENEKLATELLNTLHKIPESKNWGEKINGFPWSYGEDIGGDNWLIAANKNGNPVEKRTFSVQLLDAKKKVIASKDISFDIRYAKKFLYGYSSKNGIKSDNRNKDGYYEVESASFTFSDVSVNDADTDSLYLSIEQKSGAKTAVLPVASGLYSIRQLESIKSLRNVSLAGIIDDFSKETWKIFSGKDTLNLYNVVNSGISGDFFLDVKSLIAPKYAHSLGLFYIHKDPGIENVYISKNIKSLSLKFNLNVVSKIYYEGSREDAENVKCYYDVTHDKLSKLGYVKVKYNVDIEAIANEGQVLAAYAEQCKSGRVKITKNYDTAFLRKLNDVFGKSENSFELDLSEANMESLGDLESINISKLYLPKTVLSLNGIDGRKVVVHPESKNIFIEDGILYTNGGRTLYQCLSEKESLKIPSRVNNIRTSAFYGCRSLKTVSYGGSKKDWKAMSNAKDLEKNLKAKKVKITFSK